MRLKTPSLFRNESQKYALFGILFGFLFPIAATVIRALEAGLSLSISNLLEVQSTDRLLWIINTAPVFLGLFAGFAGYRQDRLLKVNADLLVAENELRAMQLSLEERVDQRTKELTVANQSVEKRAHQLKAIAEIARTTVVSQELDDFLHQLTYMISERLGFYHVGIFLLDNEKKFAILRAANSEGGQNMLARGHRLRVGDQGIVGFVTFTGSPRVALSVGDDMVFFNNPDLPETHSEVAVPLRFGRETFGALDIQSEQANAFSQEDVDIFTILADQISVAIQNVRSLRQAQRALQEAELASGQLTGQAWKAFTDAIRTKGYRYDGIKPEPLKKTVKSAADSDSLSVPVQLRGQTIGRLKLKSTDASHKWTEDELSIIESTADRVALAIDSARLLEDAQKRAARESFLSELAAKFGTSFQLESILRDTVEELGQTLKGSTVTFQLINPSNSAGKGNGGSTGEKESE